MSKMKELNYEQLKNGCTADKFSFQTTAELEPLEGIIGQERAEKAFDFGLAVKLKGYNIYMSGPFGTGKTTYARMSTEKMAAKEPIPNDWCYVYNFQDPKRPKALAFAPGTGKLFKEDIAYLVGKIKKELQKAFQSEEYANQKNTVLQSYNQQQNTLMEAMNEEAQKYDFTVRNTETGVYFLPVINGKAVEDEEFEALAKEVKDKIEENSQIVNEKAGIILRQMQKLNQESDVRIAELNRKVGMFAIGNHVAELMERYKEYECASAYLSALQEDVLKNLDQFIEADEEEEISLAALFSAGSKKSSEDVTLNYRVNLIVDHHDTNGAPVVVTFNPTYNNLMGEIEYDNEFGNLTTDYMKIKGGLFHQANGGYLIVQAQDILSAPHAWEALRQLMKTREINMGSIQELDNAVVVSTLKPEPIPAQLKVIMIGSGYYYELLNEYDEEFDKFFKIRADFDYEMPRTDENMFKIARFIKGFVQRENTMEFDVSAVCTVIEYSARSAESQDKLSARFNYLAEILGEAVTWAQLEQASIVTAAHIRKAIYEKEQRLKLYQEKLDAMFEDEILMINTEGNEVGQINGLAVMDMGRYLFGVPARITATAYVGKSGIVNIEKEARMSGQTHDKGVQIITGFLGQTYAQKFPMSLSCRICFEQSYNGIDGDSASSTELYCILSSLADLPIRQDLAVTGSVNQKGEIQAIGGVTYKIEGFFDLCKKRGLTGKQGVLIPVSNIRDLVLKDEVIEAVKNGMFHIYPISHINEGIELLMGMPAGKPDADGVFAPESVHGRVYAKLQAFNLAARGEE
ncbi:MAG: Lon protease family protein [Marvinbryantia sp.]|jgi:lon-related putative ATP-dependent protease